MSKKRRRYRPEFKAKVVLEVISGHKSRAEACREYKISKPLLQYLALVIKLCKQKKGKCQMPTDEKIVNRFSVSKTVAIKVGRMIWAITNNIHC